MSRIRTFVAVDIDAAVRRRAKSLIQTLASSTTAVRWVAPENLHLTLKFLGDVEDREVYGVCQAVGEAVAELRPFHSFCQGVGAFPNRQTTAHDLARVWKTAEANWRRCTSGRSGAADWGFPREIRQFRPHVTIGRVDVRHRRLGRLDRRVGAVRRDRIGAGHD